MDRYYCVFCNRNIEIPRSTESRCNICGRTVQSQPLNAIEIEEISKKRRTYCGYCNSFSYSVPVNIVINDINHRQNFKLNNHSSSSCLGCGSICSFICAILYFFVGILYLEYIIGGFMIGLLFSLCCLCSGFILNYENKKGMKDNEPKQNQEALNAYLRTLQINRTKNVCMICNNIVNPNQMPPANDNNSTIQCSGCGFKNKIETSYCTNCGLKLMESEE